MSDYLTRQMVPLTDVQMRECDSMLAKGASLFLVDPFQSAEERGRRDAAMTVESERREGDAYAAAYLAELNCPADLVEFGRNHNIPTFAEMTWQAGFVAGWRMAVARGWNGIARPKGGLSVG